MTGRLPDLSVALGLWQDRPAREALLTAAAAERCGFEELWIGEMATYDAFALAAVVGRNASSLRLTIGPLAVSVRDPMMIAMGAASVADLTGREVQVALGTSSPIVVETWHGRPRQRPLAALRECLAELRLLVDGRPGSGTGDVVRSTGYRLRLAPPRSRITVGAFGPEALRLAALKADRVVLSLVTVDAAESLAARVHDAAAAEGRPRPRVAAWVPAALDGGPSALDQVRSMLVSYLGAPGYAEMFERAGFGDVVAFARSSPHPRELLAAISDDLVRAVAAVGDADQVARRLEDYGVHLDEVAVLPCSTDADPAGEVTLAALAALSRGGLP